MTVVRKPVIEAKPESEEIEVKDIVDVHVILKGEGVTELTDLLRMLVDKATPIVGPEDVPILPDCSECECKVVHVGGVIDEESTHAFDCSQYKGKGCLECGWVSDSTGDPMYSHASTCSKHPDYGVASTPTPTPYPSKKKKKGTY